MLLSPYIVVYIEYCTIYGEMHSMDAVHGNTLVYKLRGRLNYDIWFACHANQE